MRWMIFNFVTARIRSAAFILILVPMDPPSTWGTHFFLSLYSLLMNSSWGGKNEPGTMCFRPEIESPSTQHTHTQTKCNLAHAHRRFNHAFSYYSSKSITDRMTKKKKSEAQVMQSKQKRCWLLMKYCFDLFIVYWSRRGFLLMCGQQNVRSIWAPEKSQCLRRLKLSDQESHHSLWTSLWTHLSWCHRCSLGRTWAPLCRCWSAAAGYREMQPPLRWPPGLRWMSGPCCWACSHMGNDAAVAETLGDAAGCCW